MSDDHSNKSRRDTQWFKCQIQVVIITIDIKSNPMLMHDISKWQCIYIEEFEGSRRRNHLHLDTELNFNYYNEFKTNVPDHPEGVIMKGLPLSTVKVTTTQSSPHNWPSIMLQTHCWSTKCQIQYFCTGLKPVESQTDVECREILFPVKNVGPTGPYITVRTVS